MNEETAVSDETPETETSTPKGKSKKQAVEAPRSNVFAMLPEDITIIGLDTKHKPGEHHLYDERAFWPRRPEGVAYAKLYGIPFIVNCVKEDDLVVAEDGRQRILDARAANVELKKEGKPPIRVRCVFDRGTPSKLMAVMIAGNEFRQDDTALTRCAKAQRFIDMGNTEEDAALAFGVHVNTVKDWLKVLETAPPVQKALDAGRITLAGVKALFDIPHEKQKDALAELEAAQPTGKVSTKAVRTAAAQKGSKASAQKLGKPGLKLLKQVSASDAISVEVGYAIRWAAGHITTETACKNIKGLREAMKEPKESNGKYEF